MPSLPTTTGIQQNILVQLPLGHQMPRLGNSHIPPPRLQSAREQAQTLGPQSMITLSRTQQRENHAIKHRVRAVHRFQSG